MKSSLNIKQLNRSSFLDGHMTQYMPNYCGGRFTVPPGFDFRLLPQKTKPVLVVSVIGNLDSFNKKLSSQLVENYLKKNPFSLPCVESSIQGYYDCEHQIIFLHFRDSEQLLADLLKKSNNFEHILDQWDEEKLKHLFFLFHVSHFVVITTYGTGLDTRYITLFKLLNRLRQQLRHSVDSLLRTLPLPRYCISIGRVACPRLLFVFKLSPTIAARKLAEDENRLLLFEKNLAGQIFNVFYESGLLEGNSGETRLFDLVGFSYVRVLYPDAIDPLDTFSEPYGLCDKSDLAQTLLENLIFASGMGDLLERSDCRKTMEPPKPQYPPPDRPDDRSFGSFLQCNFTELLEDPGYRQGDAGGHTSHHIFELPTCKAWFIACYKLYSSLMSDQNVSSTAAAAATAATKSVRGGSATPNTDSSSLGSQWCQFFHRPQEGSHTGTGGGCGTTEAVMSGEANAGGVAVAVTPTLLATQTQLDRRLSANRCEVALSAAEAQYRKDLPAHYSRTYHLAKVVSAFNVFMRQARGPSVLPALDRLTRRLARLYLAGRVGCPAVLLSGATCRQELHRLPDRFPEVAAVFRAALQRENGRAVPKHPLAYYAKLISSTNENGPRPVGSRTRKSDNALFADGLTEVPAGVLGQWRCEWIEAALQLVAKQSEDEQQQLKEEQQRSAVNGTGTANSTAVDSLHHLSLLPHRSDWRCVSYCNCGRLQAQRLDPFTYQEANWDFYNSLESTCCNKLTSIPLAPLFLNAIGHQFCSKTSVAATEKSSTPVPTEEEEDIEANEGMEVEGAVTSDPGGSDDGGDYNDYNDTDLQDAEEETFLDARESFGDNSSDEVNGDSEDDANSGSSGANRYPMSSSGGSSADAAVSPRRDRHQRRLEGRGSVETAERSVKRQANSRSRQHHTQPRPQRKHKQPVTFVDAMPVLGQAVGHLPMFPSWAVHALGKYFSYSHSSGLPFPGFLRGSNFLLPWDVQLSRASGSSAPATSTTKSSRGRQRDYDNVKLFLGFEMECPLGHRFFLAGPERPMTGPMQGCDVRRAVSSLLSCNLPLYQACVCSSSSLTTAINTTNSNSAAAVLGESGNDAGVGGGSAKAIEAANDANDVVSPVVWAQLMRIYVALPSAPIRIKFAPRVRPGPSDSTPVFHLGPTLDQQLDTEHTSQPADDSMDDDSAAVETNTCEPGYVYLDNGLLWVARLPFAYQHGPTTFRRPHSSDQTNNFCLLRGSISLEEL